jgi:hypothetical protein
LAFFNNNRRKYKSDNAKQPLEVVKGGHGMIKSISGTIKDTSGRLQSNFDMTPRQSGAI